ncbi:ATP-binding protein [Streptomyces coeruleorubidus]|uniref:ATP-binding protein n=1 Tax=Streptomyces coeruleorubidus TaxID=116188 RepID=UPI0037881538
MPGYEVTESRLRYVLPFEAAPAEVRLLRRAAVQQLSWWGTPVAADEAELLVAELATNVLKHVGEGRRRPCSWRGRWSVYALKITTRAWSSPSSGRRDAVIVRPWPAMLAAMAVDWGTVVTAAGKAGWCEIPLNRGRSCRRIERAVEALENYEDVARGLGQHGRGREVSFVESAVELIADLLHWTSARGHDPDDILDRAQMHYEAEADAA